MEFKADDWEFKNMLKEIEERTPEENKKVLEDFKKKFPKQYEEMMKEDAE